MLRDELGYVQTVGLDINSEIYSLYLFRNCFVGLLHIDSKTMEMKFNDIQSYFSILTTTLKTKNHQIPYMIDL